MFILHLLRGIIIVLHLIIKIEQALDQSSLYLIPSLSFVHLLGEDRRVIHLDDVIK